MKSINMILVLLIIFFAKLLMSQDINDSILYPKEEDFYLIQTLEIPEHIKLEVSGMALLPNDQLAVTTRRGEVWIVYNPYENPKYRLFARGLHEPLGIAYYKGDLYVAQRQELTQLIDSNGDGWADEYKTICTFEITGNYHEYAFGPKFDSEGNMYVTLNLGWFTDHMDSKVRWRGWMVKITSEGEIIPYAAGMRSPAGFVIDKEDNVYYAENQGDWIGSGWMTEVKEGDFVGHPVSLVWSDEPESPVKLKIDDIPDTGRPMYEVAKEIEGIKTPTVWIPHAVLGISTSDILINNANQMGPYEGQFFVGDQGQSMINRVFIEEVHNVKQGAVFPFRKGFSSGVFRLEWGKDGSLFVGMTARGWGSSGGEVFGLQRVKWNGKIPFEMRAIRAKEDGFEIEFTEEVSIETARNPASYNLRSFTYKYHHEYGSPIINSKPHDVEMVEVSADKKKVRIVLDTLRLGYIYEISVPGIISENNSALLHGVGYYTLNKIPLTGKLDFSKNQATSKIITSQIEADPKIKTIKKSRENLNGNQLRNDRKIEDDGAHDVEILLAKNTCQSCHHLSEKRVGPSFHEIAKRGYSKDEMIKLIKSPVPSNWPEYATPMPPFSHVPEHELEEIATWIKSLD